VGFFDIVAGVAQQAARAQVTIASNLTPPITVPLYGDDAGAAREPGAADWLLKLLKPSIRVDSNLGTMQFEPWGSPDPMAGRHAVALAVMLGTVAAGFAVYGVYCVVTGAE
jgi:hypothetical protein